MESKAQVMNTSLERERCKYNCDELNIRMLIQYFATHGNLDFYALDNLFPCLESSSVKFFSLSV